MPRILVLILLAAALLTLLTVPLSLFAQSEPPQSDIALEEILSEETGPARAMPERLTRIHPALLKTVFSDTTDAFLPIIVEWRQEGQAPLAGLTRSTDRIGQRRQVVRALQAHAETGGAALRSVLSAAEADGQARNVRAFWISPVMALEARPALIDLLSQHPDVAQIRPDQRFYLPQEALYFQESEAAAPGWPWNLAMIRTEETQVGLGLDGSGVVVALLDTGVDWRHPALYHSYRGNAGKDLAQHRGNWYVATDEEYLYPGDAIGHGTHVLGTMVGNDGYENRIGVAPGARWIAVKLFADGGYTLESWTHDAFQWILAPDGNPDLAPDVVNNSWGISSPGDERYRADVAALRAAGIVLLFAAGNSGPADKSVSSPGSYPETLAVGAVDADRLVASFSSRGPSPWEEVKPEIAAPGVAVRSSIPGGGYALYQGTSMATPHVAGVAALLLQAQPDLSPEQVEQILIGTAVPLGEPIPNNLTGYGLVDAYGAAMQVTARGQLFGQVLRTGGAGVVHPRVTITQRDGTSLQVRGDGNGAFTAALQPGLYDVSAEAFGLTSATQFGILIQEGGTAQTTLNLELLPTGSVFGRVVDQETGTPLSATITVSGTPLSVQADPNSGAYGLALPAGTWHLQVHAHRHQIAAAQAQVQTNQSTGVDFLLKPAPHILVVDSGRWYYYSQAAAYLASLADLALPADLWSIRNPFGHLPVPEDRPTLADLQPYDLVIWSAPLDSPGFIGMDGALTQYMNDGGKLILSGADIAYWDGGGSVFTYAPYFLLQLSFIFNGEETVDRVTGLPGSPLEGMEILLNQGTTLPFQSGVDTAWLRTPLVAQATLAQPDGRLTGALAGTCRPWRAGWLGFGLEGVAPQTRSEILDRLIRWSEVPAQGYAIQAQVLPDPQVARAGQSITHTIALYNLGTMTDTYRVEVTSGDWPIQLSHPAATGGRNLQLELGSCTRTEITATVSLPSGLAPNTTGVHRLSVRSLTTPTAGTEAELSSKTPAAILLVDDQRFYDNLFHYTDALDGLGIAYDIFHTDGGDGGPDERTLGLYPLAVWLTGYDWFMPLSPEDEENLMRYLDRGGNLLLTSQDVLDVSGPTLFNRHYLGVDESTLVVTATQVSPAAPNPIVPGQQVEPLDFPYPNWSDGLRPAVGTRPLLYDQNNQVVGVATERAGWRTVFYSFPLETLAPEALTTLLGQSLLYLSPLAGSSLTAPPAVARETGFPVTLVLSNRLAAEMPNARVEFPVPDALTVVPGSLDGGWTHNAAAGRLEWQGSLAPGQKRPFTGQFRLSPGGEPLTRLPLQARLSAGSGLAVTARTVLHVDAPWLHIAKQSSAAEAKDGDTLAYTVTVRNQGVAPVTAVVTDTLPPGLLLVADSLHAVAGRAGVDGETIHWEGEVQAGASVSLSFRAQITTTGRESGNVLLNRAYGVAGDQRLTDYTATRVPYESYLPFIHRMPKPLRPPDGR